jgi:phenylacetate-coenzyme A ligase PaaK-like adenylate-forming protein
MGTSIDARQFREEHLGPTLRNAQGTEFYRELWAGIDVSSVTLETLWRLPLVNKQQIRLAGRKAQRRQGLLCDEVFTTGTTGPPLVIVRGHREQAFVREFFAQADTRRSGRRLTRALKFNNFYHGSLVSVPAPAHCHRVCVYDAGGFEHARRVLTQRHDDDLIEPHCTLMVGGERCLRAFSYDTRHYFPEARETHLETIITYGDYLTRRWRRLLEETWGAQVIDRFSMSEVFGGATQSALCGWWHFDPYVIPEVVSQGGEPLAEGVGLLVLTALYPFQEAQPLVRYSTGDLVRVTHTNSSRPGQLAIQPLGRAMYSVPAPRGDGWLLSPASVLEAVDMIPEVERAPIYRDAAQVRDPFVIGLPRYSVSHVERGGRVEIVLRIAVAPEVVAARGGEVRRRLQDELLLNEEGLAGSIASGMASVEIVFDRDVQMQVISR